MKISQLTIHDFLGITTFSIDKAGKFNRISGDNGTGKTSVVKAITEAFQSSGVRPEIIRSGVDKAEIFIRLDDGTKIERTLTPTANKVKVVDKNGTPLPKPQTILNNLFGDHCFNPIGFFLANKKDRRQQILAAIPLRITPEDMQSMLPAELAELVPWEEIDFTKHGLEVLDQVRTIVYDTRREKGVEVKRLSEAIKQDRRDIPDAFDVEAVKSFDLQDAMTTLEVQSQVVADHQRDLAEIETLRQRVDGIKSEQVAITEQIASLTLRLEETEAELVAVNEKGVGLKDQIAAYEAPPIDETKSAIDNHQSNLKVLVRLENVETRQATLNVVEDAHGNLDKLHKILMADVPKQLLSKADLPVEGLAIDGDEITVQGISIDTLSTSEQMRLGDSIAKGLNADKELKVICIDGYEALSRKSQKEYEKTVANDGWERFVTVVGDGGLNCETAGE